MGFVRVAGSYYVTLMYAVLSFTEQDIHFALDIEESVINFSKVNNDEEGIS